MTQNPGLSSSAIHDATGASFSYSTTKRTLAELVEKKLIDKIGNRKSTTYRVGKSYQLLHSVAIDEYFEKDIDERKIRTGFNFNLIQKELYAIEVFTRAEQNELDALQKTYLENVAQLSKEEYDKEVERLAIDLSWKSSQIEGNTYTLLETERLLKGKETALGKQKDEAVMLLNHKEAIDFMIEDPTYLDKLSTSGIEDIHSILTKELGINRNLRKRRVGITGTNYRTLDNEFQIREAFEGMCTLINQKLYVLEKSFFLGLGPYFIYPGLC